MNSSASDWDEFDTLGEEEVRKRVAGHRYSGRREQQARQWLEYRASLDSSGSRRNALCLASEANDLAREANRIARNAENSAERTAAAARTSNIIASASAVAAAIAIIISIIGMLHR